MLKKFFFLATVLSFLVSCATTNKHCPQITQVRCKDITLYYFYRTEELVRKADVLINHYINWKQRSASWNRLAWLEVELRRLIRELVCYAPLPAEEDLRLYESMKYASLLSLEAVPLAMRALRENIPYLEEVAVSTSFRATRTLRR